MDIIRASDIIHSLAEGVDPFTGEVLSKESIYKADILYIQQTLLMRS